MENCMKAMVPPQAVSGFTMIEVLGVIAALAAISAIGYVAVTKAKQTADATKLEQDVESINRSIQIYLSSGGSTNGMTGADDGAPNYCDVLTILKTSGATDTLGIRSSVLDRRVYADRTNGGSTTRLRASWVPSTNSSVPPRFVIGMTNSGIVEFPINEAISANAPLTSNRTGAENVGTNGWAWNYSAASETSETPGNTPGAEVAVNSSLAALLSHPNLTGGVSIVGPSGAVTTDNKYYDGAGYMGELGIFSLDGMGDPPYNLKTAAGLKAFMEEAVRRVAAGGTEGGVAMSRDGTGHTVTFNPGTAVAFILIPNQTFDYVDNLATFPSSTSDQYPLTSLSFDTGTVTGFSQSQAVSLGSDVFAIEDLAPGSADNDYEDIVWKTSGLTQPDWSTMREVDPATYYSNWDNPTTTTVEHTNLLDRTGDVLLNGTDPTLRQVFQNLGLIP